MPKPRPDLVFIPKVSWTSNAAPAAVSYGALVATAQGIILLPQRGSETAGFELKLTWKEGGVTLADIERMVSDPAMPLHELEAALVAALPEWSTRCLFPVGEMARFDILSGWKLWLGVSAALQVGTESAIGLRIPNKAHLAELRQMYPR